MASNEETTKQEHVILLHGLGRGPGVMRKLQNYLLLHGYCAHNIDYPSTQFPVEQLADLVKQQIQPILDQEDIKIHFIGHSLGSLIIRYLLQQHPVKNLGRVVMLAPPNQGTAVVDFMEKFSFYRKIYGPAGRQLGARDNQFLKELKLPNYEFAVIAGDRSVDKFFSWFLLKGPNDGKVTVEDTKLPNMTDHLVVHATHPFLPSFNEVLQQTTYFLAHGYFQRFD